MKTLKTLPRDPEGNLKREFMANGKKYIIRSGDDLIGINRFNGVEKLGALVGSNNASFKEYHDNLVALKKMFNLALIGKEMMTDVGAKIDSMIDAVVEFSQERAHKGILLCTYFIVRENEDLRYWIKAEAEDKIQDWIEEGYDVEDFFFIALTSIPGFIDVWNRVDSRAKEKAAQSSSTGGLEQIRMERELIRSKKRRKG